MTIRVEREALLTVISTSASSLIETTTTSLYPKSCKPCIRDEDEFVIVDSVPTKHLYSDLILGSTEDDDLASLCTLSTSSVSTCDDSSDISTVERKVSFARQVVSEVRTRPRTPPEDISNLYYSGAETQTFRQEYRLEKKLLSELSIDPQSFPGDDEDLSNLVAATTSSASNGSSNGRHRISRVCVVYKDKLETFCNPADVQLNKVATQQPTAAFSSQRASGGESGDIPSDFFDNDSFWSGSLTWY
mmetsp:Transcript_22005/g.48775  ORF Transcript_22005/g.48775 Transcript_22005/m.48775 type:complete len:246 (-) Transcript_22005:719-1456(-)